MKRKEIPLILASFISLGGGREASAISDMAQQGLQTIKGGFTNNSIAASVGGGALGATATVGVVGAGVGGTYLLSKILKNKMLRKPTPDKNPDSLVSQDTETSLEENEIKPQDPINQEESSEIKEEDRNLPPSSSPSDFQDTKTFSEEVKPKEEEKQVSDFFSQKEEDSTVVHPKPQDTVNQNDSHQVKEKNNEKTPIPRKEKGKTIRLQNPINLTGRGLLYQGILGNFHPLAVHNHEQREKITK